MRKRRYTSPAPFWGPRYPFHVTGDDVVWEPKFLERMFIQQLISCNLLPMKLVNLDVYGSPQVYKSSQINRGRKQITSTLLYELNGWSALGDYNPSFLRITHSKLVAIWNGGYMGTNQKMNGGPNFIEHCFSSGNTVYAWTTNREPPGSLKARRVFGKVLHNLEGPARVTNFTTAKYFIDGQEKTLTEFKRNHLVTHLEEYKKPVSLEEFCRR